LISKSVPCGCKRTLPENPARRPPGAICRAFLDDIRILGGYPAAGEKNGMRTEAARIPSGDCDAEETV